jgi:hypothetical protein
MIEKDEVNFSVATVDGDRVFVDQFDDGVWLAIHHRRGTANTVLTKAQAREMIAALMLIVEAE